MDIQWGHNNVHMKKGDEWKAAFRTDDGLFEPTVMFFGLINLPAMFQGMMNQNLWEMINTRMVIVYLDNILIFTVMIE